MKNNLFNDWRRRFPDLKTRRIVKILGMIMGILLIEPLSAFSDLRQQRIDISVKNSSIEALIKTIKAKTGVDFLYNIREIERNGTVTLHLKNASIESILEEALKDTQLTFVEMNGVIVLKPQASIIAQEKQITYIKGEVYDNEGKTLPGVTIMIKDRCKYRS